MKILYCFPEADNPNHYAYSNIRSSLLERGCTIVDFDFLGARERLGQDSMVAQLQSLIDREKPDIFLHGIVTDELPVDFLDKLRDRTDILSIVFFSDDDWRIYNHSLHWVGHYNYATTNDINAPAIYHHFGFHHVFHVQYAANPHIYYPRKTDKKYDVTFVGQVYLGRQHLIGELLVRGVSVRVWGAGWQDIPGLRSIAGSSLPTETMIETFCASRIVLGLAWCSIPTTTGQLAPQIKGRTFEYPACGAFQITFEDDRLKHYFDMQREVVTFTNGSDLTDKIAYYLKNEEEREDIAAAAHKRVLREHTWKHRWDSFFPFLEGDNINIHNRRVWAMTDQGEEKDSHDNIKNTPLVSIVCYVYNREHYMAQTIESVLGQTYKNIEFVILNDGSTDGTETIIRRYLHDKRIKYHYQDNIGQTLDRFNELANRAVRFSSGEYICAIGADDMYLPTRVERQLREFEDYPEIDISFCNARLFDDKGDLMTSQFRHIRALTFTRNNILRWLFTLNFVPHPSVMMRRSCFERLDGYETGFAADFHFWLKAARTMNFKHLDEILWLYRIHGESSTSERHSQTCANATLDVLELTYQKYTIEEFYPEIALCSDRTKALYSAHLDFGNDMLSNAFAYLPLFAIREFQAAMAIDGNRIEARNNLAIAHLLAGNRGKAGEVFEGLRAFAKANPTIAHNLDIYDRTSDGDPRQQDYHVLAEDITNSELKRQIIMFENQKEILPGSTLTIPSESMWTALKAEKTEAGTVSIIVSVPDNPTMLIECLKHVENHTQEPHQLIVTGRALKKNEKKGLHTLLEKNPHWRYIEINDDSGPASLLNRGLEESSGEYVVFLRGDGLVSDKWLSSMLTCLKRTPDAGLIGPLTNDARPPQSTGGKTPGQSGEVALFAEPLRKRNTDRRGHTSNLSDVCILFRRDLLAVTGLPDTTLRYLWNLDLCLRAALAGHTNVLAGDVYIHALELRQGRHNNRAFTKKWNGVETLSDKGRKLIVLTAVDKARKLAGEDKLKEAVNELINTIKTAPSDKEIYCTLGSLLISAKLFDEARDALKSAPESSWDTPEFLTLMGRALEGTDHDDEAISCAEKALTKHPSYAPALNLKGLLSYKRGDVSMAESCFQSAIEYDPGYGEPYRSMGLIRWSQDVREEGFSLLTRAFVLSPCDEDSATAYHSVLSAIGSSEETTEIVRDACSLYPDVRKLHLFLVDILLQQNRPQEALVEIDNFLVRFGLDETLLNTALSLRDTTGPCIIDRKIKNRGALSVCMIAKNEEEYLARCLLSLKPIADEIIIVDTGSTDRTRDIAKAFGAHVYDFPWTNDFSEARNFSLSKAQGDWILVHDADEVISALDYGKVRAITGKKPAKQAAYTLITRNYTTNPILDGWTPNVGEYPDEEASTGWLPTPKTRLITNDKRFFFTGHVHEMLEPSLYKAAVSSEWCKEIPVHHFGKLNDEKTKAKMETYFLLGIKKLEASGGTLDSVRELAVQAGELTKYKESIKLWEMYIQSDPNYHLAYFNVSTCYLETEQFDKALAAAKKAVELEPTSKEAILSYAGVSLCHGAVQEAITSLETLLENITYPPAQVVLGAAYCMSGKTERGTSLLKELRRTGYDCSVALHSLAKKLLAAGRPDDAVSVLENMEKGGHFHPNASDLLSACFTRMRDTDAGVAGGRQ